MNDLTGIGGILTKVLTKKDPQDLSKDDSSTKTKINRPQEATKNINRRTRLISTLLVTLPIAMSGIYFFGIARNRYVVRSDFVVRKADDTTSASTSGIAALLGGGNQSSLEDARFLELYLQSPQVLQDLLTTFDFNAAYAKSGLDPFAGIEPGASRERRLLFFKNQVAVQLQEISGIITLKTIGLDPKTSLRLNEFLLQKADKFVNRLNQDINRQQLEFAAKEVDKSERRLRNVSDKLTAFQDKNEVLDPAGEASSSTAAIAALEQELGKLKVQEAAKRRQFKDPKDPEIQLIADQVDELEKQINSERLRLVSPSGKDLSRITAEAERLKGELAFATELYRASLTAAETTRVDSLRKQKFMAILSSPQLPEDAAIDWRFRGFFTVSMIILVGYALVKFVLGMAESHRE
jgi:capsular polysaccharide transport system permease protein